MVPLLLLNAAALSQHVKEEKKWGEVGGLYSTECQRGNNLLRRMNDAVK